MQLDEQGLGFPDLTLHGFRGSGLRGSHRGCKAAIIWIYTILSGIHRV